MSFVRVEKPRPRTSVIVMDRPERLNSMAFELVVPLHEALEQVAADNDTGVVILTAAAALWAFWPFGQDKGTLQLPGTVEIQEVGLGSKTGGRVAASLLSSIFLSSVMADSLRRFIVKRNEALRPPFPDKTVDCSTEGGAGSAKRQGADC